jgi:hypothetical protein
VLINSAISFWVFFPIFKVIFKTDPTKAAPAAVDDPVVRSS